MSVLRFGSEQSTLILSQTWRSPFFVSGNGGVAGLWVQPERGTRPLSWDQAGFVYLAAQTNPNLLQLRLEDRLCIFEEYTLCMFPTYLTGTEFRIEVRPVDWVTRLRINWGTVTII